MVTWWWILIGILGGIIIGFGLAVLFSIALDEYFWYK